MRRFAIAGLVAALLLPACTEWQNPRPGPIRAMEPRPNPPLRAATAARVSPSRPDWLPRFWEELSPAQRRVVLSRLRRGPLPRVTGKDDAPAAWDVMGLPEREVLVTGRSAPKATDADSGTAVATH